MIKTIIFILYAAFIISCNNHKAGPIPLDALPDSTEVSARVADQGNPAADGCGWHIISDVGIDYIPKNLNADFQIDSLAVIISFKIEGKLACGFTAVPNEFPAINLIEIRKK